MRTARHLFFVLLTLMAVAAYGGAAWVSAGGDDTWVVVLTLVLFVVTVWSGRSTLRI